MPPIKVVRHDIFFFRDAEVIESRVQGPGCLGEGDMFSVSISLPSPSTASVGQPVVCDFDLVSAQTMWGENRKFYTSFPSSAPCYPVRCWRRRFENWRNHFPYGACTDGVRDDGRADAKETAAAPRLAR